MNNSDSTDGIIVVNKPGGITSYDVIRFLKRLIGRRKIGHAGTLDPLAEGVLIVCLGSATKLSARFMGLEKEYRAEIRLGVTTDTYDAGGAVLEERPVSVRRAEVDALLPEFTGEIRQVPPVVSALKHRGQPLYKLYRRGITVTPEARTVVIRELEVLEFAPPRLVIRVVCSRGTYIRTLAHDIGRRLGCGAMVAGLQRTRIGRFTLRGSHSLAEIERLGVERVLIPSPELAGDGTP